MRRALLAGAAVLTSLVTTALPSAAMGGWATSALDEAPQAEPGATTEIGFTILQHGRTPVNVDGVSVLIRGVEGRAGDQVWPAVQQGATGHYVAEVTFPGEGEYGWAIRQGWFGDHELGSLRVGDVGVDGTAAGSWWARTSWTLRIALLLPIVAAAGLFVLDRNHERRRTPDRSDEVGHAGGLDRFDRPSQPEPPSRPDEPDRVGQLDGAEGPDRLVGLGEPGQHIAEPDQPAITGG